MDTKNMNSADNNSAAKKLVLPTTQYFYKRAMARSAQIKAGGVQNPETGNANKKD